MPEKEQNERFFLLLVSAMVLGDLAVLFAVAPCSGVAAVDAAVGGGMLLSVLALLMVGWWVALRSMTVETERSSLALLRDMVLERLPELNSDESQQLSWGCSAAMVVTTLQSEGELLAARLGQEDSQMSRWETERGGSCILAELLGAAERTAQNPMVKAPEGDPESQGTSIRKLTSTVN